MSKDSFLKLRRGKLHKKMFYMASTITQINKSTKCTTRNLDSLLRQYLMVKKVSNIRCETC